MSAWAQTYSYPQQTAPNHSYQPNYSYQQPTAQAPNYSYQQPYGNASLSKLFQSRAGIQGGYSYYPYCPALMVILIILRLGWPVVGHVVAVVVCGLVGLAWLGLGRLGWRAGDAAAGIAVSVAASRTPDFTAAAFAAAAAAATAAAGAGGGGHGGGGGHR